MRGWMMALVAAATALALTGCHESRFVAESTTQEPPPPPAEALAEEPVRPGHVWVRGNWNFTDQGWVWRDGYWMRRAPGHLWVQRRWAEEDDRWTLEPGGWTELRTGHAWVPGRYVLEDERYVWQPGHWRPMPVAAGPS